MPYYTSDGIARRYEFLVEKRDYGRAICLAVLDEVPYVKGDAPKVQMMKLVPHMEPVRLQSCLSGNEDPSMILSDYEARELLTALIDAGIRPL